MQPLFYFFFLGSEKSQLINIVVRMIIPITTKITSIPTPMYFRFLTKAMGSNWKAASKLNIQLTSHQLSGEAQDDTACDNGGNLTGDINTDGVH